MRFGMLEFMKGLGFSLMMLHDCEPILSGSDFFRAMDAWMQC